MPELIHEEQLRHQRHILGSTLQNCRKQADLKQSELANAVGYSRSTIANVETGRQVIDADFWRRCDQLLHANGDLMTTHMAYESLVQQHKQEKIAAARSARARLLPEESSVPVLHSEHPHALLMNIRNIMTTVGLTSHNETTVQQRLGEPDVLRLNAVTQLYQSIDNEHGGGVLHIEVGKFAEKASALLERDITDSLRPQLLTAVAGARQLAGWAAFDAGAHSHAQRHWLAAERSALAAGDTLLVAKVRYCQAKQFQHLRHNRDALDTLNLATEQLGTRTTPAITAMLCGARASSLAALSDFDRATENLEIMSENFARIGDTEEPAWMRFYDNGERLAQYGRVYRDLARQNPTHAATAVQWADAAVAAFESQRTRSGLLNLVGLSSALFLAGETEQAISTGLKAVEQGRTLTSARVLDRIHNLQRDIHDTKNADARDFARTLTTVRC